MRRNLKKNIGKWFDRSVWVVLILFVLYFNANRLFDNNYANYEKAVDYGRVREAEEKPLSAVAAVFYMGKSEPKGSLTTYFNHADNYKKENVKMIAAPKHVDQSARTVVEKLYAEVSMKNEYDRVFLVHDQSGDWAENRRMLNKLCEDQVIEPMLMNEDETSVFEEKINACLQEEKCLVVWVVDLSEGLKMMQENSTVRNMIFFAKKMYYHMKVFDVIDTQMASVPKSYNQIWGYYDDSKTASAIVKQKYNLRRYIQRYGGDLLKYFKKNLQGNWKQNILWPAKNAQNFRLYDRGSVHVRLAYGNAVISKTKSDEAVVVSVIKIARSFARKYPQAKFADAKLYLLTDKEYIDVQNHDSLENFAAQDEGVGAEYGNHSAILFPQERENITENWPNVLRQKLNHPPADAHVKYFKFGIEEIKNEN